MFIGLCGFIVVVLVLGVTMGLIRLGKSVNSLSIPEMDLVGSISVSITWVEMSKAA